MCNPLFLWGDSLKISEIKEILETLLEQGFIEWASPAPPEISELAQNLYMLGIVDEPREVGGSFGAVLKDEVKARALLALLTENP